MISLREQIEGRCVHFNGVMNDKCEAGIVYDRTKPLPCLKWREGGDCPKRRWPTAEEVAEELADIKAEEVRFTKVLPLIGRIKKEHKGHSWKGVETCPGCGGKLHLRHAAYNGHVWGKCETEGCLSWME